jgi:hypothetical protein
MKLGALLEEVNMLPPGLPLMSFKDALLLAESQSTETVGLERARRALDLCLDGLSEEDRPPNSFRDYILGLPDSKFLDAISALQDAVSRYENFREARLKLCGVAKINNLSPGLREFERFLESLGAGTRTEIDEQGRVRFIKDWFGEAAEGEEAARIRECRVCQQVFWAGRIDQSCCKPRCADILRKRNKRKRDAEQRLEDKVQRVENERYKEQVSARRAQRARH